MRIINILIFAIGFISIGTLWYSRRENPPERTKWIAILWKYKYLILVMFLANVLSFGMSFMPEEKEFYIEKEGYGGEEQQISLRLQKGEDRKDIYLSVRPKQLTEKELKNEVERTFSRIEEEMKGSNDDITEIYDDLNFSFVLENCPFSIEIYATDLSLIGRDGKVNNTKKLLESQGYNRREIEQGIPVDIHVCLQYEEKEFERTYKGKVFLKEETLLEQEFLRVEEILMKAEQDARYENGFTVQRNVSGIGIERSGENTITPEMILLSGIILCVLLVLRDIENDKKQLEDRKKKLIRSYPWFVNEIVLLLGAGLQTRNVFTTIIREFETNKTQEDLRFELVKELKVAIGAMELGMSEEQAYYKLGRRLGLPRYIKLMTILEQNVKRGGRGITEQFEQEEIQALEERKNLARRYGEEASTKLLGPMIMLLMVVMLMIMIPALWNFR